MAKKEYLSGLATVWPEDVNQAPDVVYFQPPKNRMHSAKWLLLWQGETGSTIQEQAEMEVPLTQTEYRVRDWIIGEIGLGNYVYINQAEVGRHLRIARTHVSAAIKRLVELEILIKGPKNGRSNTYMVNPGFCFSGALGNGVKAMRESAKTHTAKITQFKPKSDA